jgi:hypothetical protein
MARVVPPRFPLLLFDVVEQSWLGCFDPEATSCARVILDSIAVLDNRLFRFCLLRTLSLHCVMPNPRNWSTVTVMVVHESPWEMTPMEMFASAPGEARLLLGVQPSWVMGDVLPQVPVSFLFDWTCAVGACCDPFNFVRMTDCLAVPHSHLPPPQLREAWEKLVQATTPCTPLAREGRRVRMAAGAAV